ncbi:hypothetical protein [Actinopolyspora mortivallis]|uniref:Ig-like domain-containing protein n=1 Tax=Actinopolyspora mortivallis TaxID=33906 RepID=A0A2T0GXI0_ACTMO|nr:hypothetical protein [Actinopolyspora mortivallis]PRW63804.1 hypothetical protein CEP50_08455 [Actinopolyspora mortivallis]
MRLRRATRTLAILAAAALFMVPAVGMTTGSGSAEAVTPHTICGPAGSGEVTFDPALGLTLRQTDFEGFGSAISCQGAFSGSVEIPQPDELEGSGELMSCESSFGLDGSITFTWSDGKISESSITGFTVNQVSKVVIVAFRVDSGRFAGDDGKVTFQSTSESLECAVGGLEKITGKYQVEFGI